MSETQRHYGQLPNDQHTMLLELTGRRDVTDALHWIAEGRLVSPVIGYKFLETLVAATELKIPGAAEALRPL